MQQKESQVINIQDWANSQAEITEKVLFKLINGNTVGTERRVTYCQERGHYVASHFQRVPEVYIASLFPVICLFFGVLRTNEKKGCDSNTLQSCHCEVLKNSVLSKANFLVVQYKPAHLTGTKNAMQTQSKIQAHTKKNSTSP